MSSKNSVSAEFFVFWRIFFTSFIICFSTIGLCFSRLYNGTDGEQSFEETGNRNAFRGTDLWSDKEVFGYTEEYFEWLVKEFGFDRRSEERRVGKECRSR